jgi:hypothetical protein
VQAGRRIAGLPAPRARRAVGAWLAAALLGAGTTAVACPICLGAGQQTVAQQLAAAPQAVLALPTADAGQFRVVEVIRGERPSTRSIEGGYPRAASTVDVALRKGEALLLIREEPLPGWVVLGAIGTDQAGWLRKLAVGQRTDTLSAPQWRDRIARVAPKLESPQPLVAKIAHGELSAAPYAAMRSAKLQVEARKVRAWLADSQLAARQRLYLLLLGIAGDDRDAAALEQRLDAAWLAGDATNLAPMLTADLELRGPARVNWVEERYLRDRSRSAAEVDAALLALSVQGQTNAAIPRERVIQAYRAYMKSHPENAGNVAPDLAAWQYWDAVPEYQALIKSGVRQQYPSMLAMMNYLRQSPGGSAAGAAPAGPLPMAPAPTVLRAP